MLRQPDPARYRTGVRRGDKENPLCNHLKIFATEHSLLSTFRHRSVDCVIERLQTKMSHTHGALRRDTGAPTIQLRLKMMEFSALNVLKQHVIQIWR